ncbi:DUF1761 domain-containing protein [Candidatus Micrarchaeota archaeon]|nr:DUF1761 domain-containing protein [Candidatus Micrarchaeota archaeon]
MVVVETNIIAILGAAIASFVVGMIWYSPFLFGKEWMKLSGYKDQKDMQKGAMKSMGISFIAAIVTAFVLDHILQTYETTTIDMAVQGAFWVWLGFTTTVQLTHVLFQKQHFKLYLINTSHQLASLIVMAIVLIIL